MHDTEATTITSRRSRSAAVALWRSQAVGRLAKEAEAAAHTEDGIIEAIWAPAYKYAVGVQWHPECLAEEDHVQADIFKSLVTKAGE